MPKNKKKKPQPKYVTRPATPKKPKRKPSVFAKMSQQEFDKWFDGFAE